MGAQARLPPLCCASGHVLLGASRWEGSQAASSPALLPRAEPSAAQLGMGLTASSKQLMRASTSSRQPISVLCRLYHWKMSPNVLNKPSLLSACNCFCLCPVEVSSAYPSPLCSSLLCGWRPSSSPLCLPLLWIKFLFLQFFLQILFKS